MSLTHEDVQKILTILDEAGCEEAEIEFGDSRIYVRKHVESAGVERPHRSCESDAQACGKIEAAAARGRDGA